MGYCTIDDVRQLSTGRPITASSSPNASQAVDYIEQTAAVIDGLLRGQGHGLPVPTTATSVLKMLEGFNAAGAACLVEHSAPTQRSARRGEIDVCAMWKSAQAMLRDGSLEFDIPLEGTTSLPRGGPVASPFFGRDMRL